MPTAKRNAKKGTKQLKAENALLDKLKPHPRNYQAHPEDQVAHLVASIREHGFYKNVVVAQDNTILAGHGAVRAAQEAGLSEIPIVRLNIAPNSPQALKLLAGDNEIGKMADRDDRALTELLKEIGADDFDYLLGSGFDEQMLAAMAMVTRPASEIPDFNAAAEWASGGMPECDPGELRFRLVVQFESEAEREAFVAKCDIAVKSSWNQGQGDQQTWSAWWPPRTKEDTSSVVWAEDERAAEAK